MKKKLLALALVGIMALSLLSACGKSSSTPNSGGTAGADATAGTATSVTWWMDPQNLSSTRITSYNDSICWQEYEKNLGVDIVWQEPASGQAAEQFNLVIAGNELPDIMYYSWLSSYPGGPDAAIADGKIVALNDYIDEYAPNLAAYLKAHPDVAKEVTTDSGNIYCFPAIYTCTDESSDVWQGVLEREPYEETFIGLVVRKELLDKAGLDTPVTVDDWYEALTAFKGLGIKYPISFMATFGTLAQSFGTAYDVALPTVGMGAASAFTLREDGSIMYGPAEDGYGDYLAFMNKLYSEGLLDPDFMVQDRTTLQSKILNGEVGAWIEMMPAGLGTMRSQILAEDPNSDFYPIGVLNPVAKEGQKLRYKQGSLAYIGSGAAITTSCKDIATACRVLDYGWSEEGNMLLNWGVEGVSYEMVDGWPQMTQDIINDPQGVPSQAFSLYRQLNGPYPMDHTQRIVTKTDYTLEEGQVDENIAALDLWSSTANGVTRAGIPSTTMLAEEASEYATTFNEIGTYTEEMFSKFIMGAEPIENFPQYQDTLQSMGLSRVLELQETALERYYNRVA